MKTSFVSSQGIADVSRSQLLRMQAELTKLEKEVVSGRVADAGVALGGRTGQSVSLERDVDRLSGIIDSNGAVTSRLSATQAGLQSLQDLSQKFLSTMTGASSGTVSSDISKSEAETLITSMTGILNSNLNGENLFAGVNTDVKPINDFFATGSPARTAMENAFQTYFGFAVTDPAAAGIDETQMTDFLTNVIEPQFTGADWQTNWSNASDETITARITLTDTATVSVGANINGVRMLALAGAAITTFIGAQLGDGARDALVGFATSKTGQATADLAQVQAQTGLVEQRVASASDRLQMQIDIFKGKISDLVEIDPYEASTRVSSLLSQIETAYTLTSRLRQLSLVNYLPT
jgi:flagellar hook-associated protein 3 FlgL